MAQPPDASPQIIEEPMEREAWRLFRKFGGWSLIAGGINNKEQLWASGFTSKTDTRLTYFFYVVIVLKRIEAASSTHIQLSQSSKASRNKVESIEIQQ